MQTRGYQGLHETAGISLAVGQDRVGKGDALPAVRDYWLTPNPGWNAFPMRRKFLAVLLMLFLGITQAHTQQGASPFIGEWKGQIEGIGEARLVIAAVKSNGQIEGQMAFSLKSFVSTFGDKADSAKNTSLGIVSDSTLSIESALGGKYELARTGNQLTGIYTRGTTFRGSASFAKM